jgi:hypothetical protein
LKLTVLSGAQVWIWHHTMDQQAECSRRITKARILQSLASLKPSLNVFSKKSDLLQSNFLWRYQIGSFRPDINAHLAIRQESVSRQGIQSKTALKGFPVERKPVLPTGRTTGPAWAGLGTRPGVSRGLGGLGWPALTPMRCRL